MGLRTVAMSEPPSTSHTHHSHKGNGGGEGEGNGRERRSATQGGRRGTVRGAWYAKHFASVTPLPLCVWQGRMGGERGRVRVSLETHPTTVCIQVTYLSHARYTTPSPSVPGPTAMLRYYAPCPPSPRPHHHAGANADSSFREEVGEEGEGEHDVRGG